MLESFTVSSTTLADRRHRVRSMLRWLQEEKAVPCTMRMADSFHGSSSCRQKPFAVLMVRLMHQFYRYQEIVPVCEPQERLPSFGYFRRSVPSLQADFESHHLTIEPLAQGKMVPLIHPF